MVPNPDAATGRPSRRTGILKRPCPHCGQVALRRVVDGARRIGGSTPGKDYPRATQMHCTAPGCGLDSWVPRRLRRRRAVLWTQRRWRQVGARLRPWARVIGMLGLLGLGAGVGAAVGAVWERAQVPTAAQLRAALPAGEYHDGDPLPAAHPLSQPPQAGRTGLDLRGACVWGRPGRDPYRGSVAEALSAARLPAEVQAALVAKTAAGQRDGRLVIANDGIRDPDAGRVFAARGFAMTYGRTLCLETRVNFAAGHVEAADLYEARDGAGRRYSIMVPDVCGNVSVVAEAVAADDPLKPRWIGGHGMPSQLRLATLATNVGDGGPRGVPEPGTLALVLAAIVGWALSGRRRR